MGRYGAGDKENVWEMSMPSTPQHTDLFQGQWSTEVGGFLFGIQGLKVNSCSFTMPSDWQLEYFLDLNGHGNLLVKPRRNCGERTGSMIKYAKI